MAVVGFVVCKIIEGDDQGCGRCDDHDDDVDDDADDDDDDDG